MTVRPITDAESELFDAIRDPEYTNFALVSTALDGEPTAAIATIHQEGDEYIVTPVAILVTDEIMDRLAPPDEGLLSRG